MIKVAMIVRSTLYTVKGGDTTQVVQTATHLAKKNIHVDIKLTHEAIDYSKYDLLHFFNITRPADMLFHIKRSAKPFVVSTIFIDYSEYDKQHRGGLLGMLFSFFGSNSIEYLKTVSRWILGKDKLMSIAYLWKGQRNLITEILNKAALLLPNSHSEYRRLQAAYRCNTPYVVVPNGVDPHLFKFNKSVEKDPALVICVARIEGIKNQLNLIKALNNSRYKLLIIGASSPNQQAYYRNCRRSAAPNVIFIDQLFQNELISYYQKATVHVLPSWFETTGLSSLEAAAMGCNIVITDRGDTMEYFAEEAVYCDPSSPEDIFEAVEKAASKKYSAALQEKILIFYSWQQATARTMEAYERINKLWY
ncbi:MAG: glycosyltransferase family 4 protein [Ferruginibacter sp.]|nr:glycosyltransferase family 4 protein [Ferruginibacter sp.]